MRIYPNTNRIQDSNDIKAEDINKEVRSCFDLGNGAIDEKNIELGDANQPSDITTPGTGVDNRKFASKAWSEYIKGPTIDVATDFDFTFDDDNRTAVLYRYSTTKHSGVGQGVVSGQLQVRYSIATIEGSATAVPYTKNVFETAMYHKHSIYANGLVVGETDNIAEGPIGTVNVPFFFYHPGGDLEISCWAGPTSGGKVLYPTSGSYRYIVENAYYWATVRKR